MPETCDGNIRVIEAEQAPPRELVALLDEAFGPVKQRFLTEHGDWWHHGEGGRFVVTCDDAIAGYRAAVPTVCLFEGKELPGVWAMDLYVTPRFRGRGLQKVLDQRLLDAAELRMSFPNETGARIYIKQGHGLRRDLQVLRAPLFPGSVEPVRNASGGRGMALRAGALGFAPIAAVLRARALRFRPRRTEIVDNPDPNVFEDVFRRHVTPSMVTTLRSAEFLQWRYFDAPYRAHLVFYLAGSWRRPTHYAVVRYLPSGRSTKARILDLFGDFEDQEGLSDLLRTIVRDATFREAGYVGFLVCSPELVRTARRVGFLASDPKRFRWLADNPMIQDRFSTAQLVWTIGDGEHDDPR